MERICQNPCCGKTRRVEPNRLKQGWKGCDYVCASVARLSGHAHNDLQRRVLEHMTRTHKTLPEFAHEADVVYETVNLWFRRPQATLQLRILKQLAGALGISVAQALAEAGGQTDDMRRRQFGHAHLERMRREGKLPQPGSEEARAQLQRATAAAAVTNRGRTMSPDAVRRSVETRRKSGALDRAHAGLRSSARSEDGRLRTALTAQLRWHSQPNSPYEIRVAAVVRKLIWLRHQLRRNGSASLQKRVLTQQRAEYDRLFPKQLRKPPMGRPPQLIERDIELAINAAILHYDGGLSAREIGQMMGFKISKDQRGHDSQARRAWQFIELGQALRGTSDPPQP